ncbi:MAG TPA: dienelactone hydrolase family protein [Solirubrobacteraceae bacterium]|nr:dienelactone hydrolase family protein [Solirubrobacteraceae bacterium]
MIDSFTAGTVAFDGHRGDEIEAYLARPAGFRARAGVVVIHHRAGCDRGTKEIVRRLAELGYDAICPNLLRRGAPDERLIADAAGATRYLLSLPTSNRKIGVIGFGSGGSQAVLAACNIDYAAAIDCYGAFAADELPRLRAPLLGLFGSQDAYPNPAQVAELDELLSHEDKPHEFHSYDRAGHDFFAVDQPSYSVAAANDGWGRIAAFYTDHLGG